MVAHDVEVLGPVDHGIMYSIYFHDPNGNRLEITAPVDPDWNDMGERARALGGSLQLRAGPGDVGTVLEWRVPVAVPFYRASPAELQAARPGVVVVIMSAEDPPKKASTAARWMSMDASSRSHSAM